MKKFFAGTAVVLAAVLLLSCPAGAISAQKAILLDGLTGQILYEKQADRKSLIASTTKIMTALLVCENCNVLDIVEIPQEAVGIEGSSIYLQVGEKLTVQELLYGMMLHSGNDAATALAIFCGGSTENFVAMMNEKAQRLGLRNTRFANPHGLDAAEHYSTARDLGQLAKYAMKNPLFARTVSAKTVRAGQRSLVNHNKLLWRVEGAEGVKTGYTRAAGRILVSSARRQGRRLIAVTIDDGNDWADHAALYEQGFARYKPKTVIRAGQSVGKLDVFGGEKESVDLIAVADVSVSLASGEKVTVRTARKGMVFAPVAEGADAGGVYLCVNGQMIAKVAVRYGQTVELCPQAEKRPFWKRHWRMT